MVNQRSLTDVLLWSIRQRFVNYGVGVAAGGVESNQWGGGIDRLSGALIADPAERASNIEQGTGGTTGSAGDAGAPINHGDLGDVVDDFGETYGGGGGSNQSGGETPGGDTGGEEEI